LVSTSVTDMAGWGSGRKALGPGLVLLTTLQHCQAPASSPEEHPPGAPATDDVACRAVEQPILYHSRRNSAGLDAHVFSMKADGSAAEEIEGNGDFYGSVWSPDGRRIAFRRSGALDGEPVSEIGLMAPDGTEVVSLVVDQRGSSTTSDYRRDGPSWSADGRSIAFASRQDSEPWAIWAVSSSGGAPRRLMPELEVPHFDASFSPRSEHELAYIAATGGALDLWRVDLSSVVHENLTNGRVSEPRSPRWSADGQRLVFSAEAARSLAVRERPRGVYVLELLTGELSALTNDSSEDFSPVFSPDGLGVLFASQPPPEAGRQQPVIELWRVSLDAVDSRVQVTRDLTDNFAPDWYPYRACDGLDDESATSP